MWALVVGFLLPPALAVVQQTGWPSKVKAVVAFAASALAGAGTAYFQGDLTGRRFVEAGLVVLVAAMATYHGFWKPTEVAPKIEKATTPG
jgi:VIT1/CCC1 family predicted Fe2+/Mn2+ transporter